MNDGKRFPSRHNRLMAEMSYMDCAIKLAIRLTPPGYEVKRTWRIVDTCNYGRDYPSETFVAIDLRTQEEAEMLAAAHNNRSNDEPRFYRVVDHVEIVYKLQPGFEP